MKKRFITALIAIIIIVSTLFSACKIVDPSENIKKDNTRTIAAANDLQGNQPTPTDIDYSLERYNLIRRAYWVNGQREKARSLPCQIQKPLGYIVLFAGNAVVGNYIVDGKVTSLNSFLTPDYQYFSDNGVSPLTVPRELADVDGSYGENDSGVFFFTPDGKYIEWTGDYLYSDIPFEVDDPVVHVSEGE